MFEIFTIIGAFLLIRAFYKSNNSAKSITIAIILMMLFVDVGMSANKAFSSWLVVGGREFMVRPMLDLMLVILLHIKPCRETAIIMILSLCSVFINIIGYTLYLSQSINYFIFDVSLMTVFYAMLLILLNKGISDGVYRSINRFSIIRCYCVDHLKINHKRAR